MIRCPTWAVSRLVTGWAGCCCCLIEPHSYGGRSNGRACPPATCQAHATNGGFTVKTAPGYACPLDRGLGSRHHDFERSLMCPLFRMGGRFSLCPSSAHVAECNTWLLARPHRGREAFPFCYCLLVPGRAAAAGGWVALGLKSGAAHHRCRFGPAYSPHSLGGFSALPGNHPARGWVACCDG